MLRARALDGLRGWAALIVVIYHTMLCVPIFDEIATQGKSHGNWLVEQLTYTPLHFFWAGGEAVYLFFVISGFALAHQLEKIQVNRHYFISRFVRLYFPTVVSLVLAFFLWQLALLQKPSAAKIDIAGTWAKWVIPDLHDPFKLVSNLALDSLGSLNPPVWSLKVEIIFSMVAFAYVMWLKNFEYRSTVLISIGVAAIAYESDLFLIHYLAVFAIGVAIYLRMSDQSTKTIKIGRWHMPELSDEGKVRQSVWARLFTVSVICSQALWIKTSVQIWPMVHAAVMLAGIYGIVLSALYFKPLNKALIGKFSSWLGKISFSLYLVHLPIILISVYLWPNNLVALLSAALLSIAIAWLFWMGIERPIHAYSRKLRLRNN